ncbi:MAG: polysaccharide export outer membrane protein, partial [Flavobacteriales bacterium]
MASARNYTTVINKCPNVFKTLFLTGAILFATLVTAQTPSPAQIAQFKSMPPAQQKALAQSMGIDINDFSGILGGNDAAPTFTSEVVSQNRSPAKTIIADPKDDLEVAGVNEKEDIQKLKFFGYDIFQFGADSFTPASDIPIPSNYIVGPGDTLIVQLYGKESATHTLSINRDGSVQFPEIGPISLAGLSFSDTEKKISEVVSEQMIGIKSSITMGALRTIRIFVLGEVNVPGSYVVGSLSTMTNAIFASGGITKLGSLRNVQLKRAGKTITSLDLYALLLKGDTSQDSRLLPGDVIFIPPLGRTAGISGAVKRPAMYELRNEATVEDLLKMSGGLTPHAYLDATKIERIFKTGEKSLVSLNLTNRNAYNTPIHDADILHIGSTLDLFLDTITVQGHVKRPDDLAWRAGLKFTDLISSSDQLLDLPDLDIAIIERKVPITGEIEVYSFSPGEALMNPKGPSDPHISSRDRVTIFDYTTDRAVQLQSLLDRLAIQADIDQHQKSLNIQGSIRFPGTYPL